MKIKQLIIWVCILVLFLLLMLAALDDIGEVVANSYQRYFYFLGGCLLMFLVDRYTSKNNRVLKTLHHESTHMFFNLVTFRKVLMIQVDMNGGVVSSVGNKWMLEAVSLSPYSFPLAAYIVMAFGYFFANDMTHIYAVILGVTYAFHLLCIKEDFGPWPVLGRHQPDINQYPLLFSYLYIFCFWLFNTFIVLLSVRRDIIAAYSYVFNCFIETIMDIL